VPEEYDQFLVKYKEGSLLVAFGTTWQPTEEMVSTLVAAARKMHNVGFIISLKDSWAVSKMVKDANLDNVFLKDFVPQKELLND